MLKSKTKEKQKLFPFMQGILLTFIFAAAASYTASFSLFSIIGPLIIAMMIGIMWRAFAGISEPVLAGAGFSSKKLLRFGIILLGMRLNLSDLYHAGFNVFILSLIVILFTIPLVYALSRFLEVDKKISILTACGTAICGAAAVAAIAPLVKANEEETAVSAGTIAILGTAFTLLYTFIYSFINLTPYGFGAFSGGTLHEVAHVVAAASIGGAEAEDMAIILKLTRVALLVPAALIVGILFREKKTDDAPSPLPIPWFILGFLFVSGLNTAGIASEETAAFIVSLSYLLIGMAMAGLGLNVNLKSFKKLGSKPLIAGLTGSLVLSAAGYGLVLLLGLN
ncbi:YeiH family protein [Peribacillus frigoritolerans]|uniref:YeiH family protein n=1 Tax=Peribacillus frigoritolerans TaxID=450367 RepID=UPI00105AABF0|nr:YeiH family protein [Peribacillus frigoritolerans]TDL78803.1 YeiH family putative sulfate export transporter [Peribacillus frigoritolerans]